MLRRLYFGIALLGLCLSYQRAWGAGIAWSHSLKSALIKARSEHRLVMLDIYTDWCYWCKRLDSDVYPQSVVVQAARQVIPVKLNAETTKEGRAAAERYEVTGYPTVLFLDGQGQVVGRIGGYEPAPNFAADVDHIVAEYRQLPGLESYVRSHPNDGAAALRLLHIYVEAGRLSAVEPLIARIRRVDPSGSKNLLAEALLLGGSAYIHAGNVSRAAADFKEAAQKTRIPDMQAEAHMYLAMLYAAQNQLTPATTQLKAVLAIRGCSAQMHQAAQQMLSQIQAAQLQTH
ncbi:Thioredoxin [Chthonomonas calidirosea]|uniref:Thioredoxin-like n=1 Tax=Chthonomonas calidirosea (strain DSM 23976 / ICMP 18418 / T49) TaxID=1303518 RepID=S0EW67_CHTCT|nr:thioredoxin fold domain-containing protein [Chthonomonas calidirosea]CCW36113.1 Thioredoxin-like [Chthonomonas calidirosea T49]CEK18301.1 Thioredoxin [Chthonomonas calidirosea]